MSSCASVASVGGRPCRAMPQSSRRPTVPRARATTKPSNTLSPELQPLINSPRSLNSFKVLFSDIDGTCVHYTSPLGFGKDGAKSEVLQLPPSRTGAHGVISVRTLQLYAVVRTLGAKLVLISGARLSTVMQRLPYLPAADAIVAESGGRIYYPGQLPTCAPLQEDMGWRQVNVEGAGPAGLDAVPPEEREGILWRFYAAIQAGDVPGLAGVRLDANNYTTAFRVRLSNPGQAAVLQAAAPQGLTTAINLGYCDVFPDTAGKENAALHLMQRYGVQPSDCVFMCDDDNDLKLANLVRRAYLPGISADSVREAVLQNPSRFHVSSGTGVWGTEELLELLISEHMAGYGIMRN